MIPLHAAASSSTLFYTASMPLTVNCLNRHAASPGPRIAAPACFQSRTRSYHDWPKTTGYHVNKLARVHPRLLLPAEPHEPQRHLARVQPPTRVAAHGVRRDQTAHRWTSERAQEENPLASKCPVILSSDICRWWCLCWKALWLIFQNILQPDCKAISGGSVKTTLSSPDRNGVCKTCNTPRQTKPKGNPAVKILN